MVSISRCAPVVLVLGLAACASAPSSAAPPLVVCGQTLNDTPAGAVLTDATVAGRVDGRLTSRNAVFIRVSNDCNRGAQVTFTPADKVTTIARATAKDGQLVAIGVTSPVAATGRVVHPDGSVSTITIPAG